MSEKLINILGCLTLVTILGAAWVMFGEDPKKEQGARGERIFAGLEKRINEAQSFTVTQDGNTVTVEKSGDVWAVQERSGYKAEKKRVVDFLRGVALSDRREPKTANKDLYARLGLGGKALKVALKDDTGGQLLAFDMGKRSGGRKDKKSLTYVSQERDTRSWLVTGLAEASADPVWWLEKKVLAVGYERVVLAQVGEVQLTRKEGERDFELADLKEGEEAISKWQLLEPARMISNLTFEDVQKVSNPLSDPVGTAFIKTNDGLKVTLTLYKIDDAIWAQAAAAVDLPEFVDGAEAEEAMSQGNRDDLYADRQEEVANINAKIGGWLFKLSDNDGSTLTRERRDFLTSGDEQ